VVQSTAESPARPAQERARSAGYPSVPPESASGRATRNEIRLRYAGSILGVTWVVLAPALLLIVYMASSTSQSSRYGRPGPRLSGVRAFTIFAGLIPFPDDGGRRSRKAPPSLDQQIRRCSRARSSRSISRRCGRCCRHFPAALLRHDGRDRRLPRSPGGRTGPLLLLPPLNRAARPGAHRGGLVPVAHHPSWHGTSST